MQFQPTRQGEIVLYVPSVNGHH